MSDIRRRKLVALISGAVASWPLTGHAQQRPKIGFINTELGAAFALPFMGKLAELGLVKGKNIVIERRSAGRKARTPGRSRRGVGAPAGQRHCDGRDAGGVCCEESDQHDPYRSWRQ